jgi:hypothetical protein
MNYSLRKRLVIIALAAAGGAGAGGVYATVLAACSTCAVGAHPLVVTVGLAAVAAYSAIVATRQQV